MFCVPWPARSPICLVQKERMGYERESRLGWIIQNLCYKCYAIFIELVLKPCMCFYLSSQIRNKKVVIFNAITCRGNIISSREIIFVPLVPPVRRTLS